jgi:hypothetical protein
MRDRIPTLGDAAKPYTRDSANQAFFDYRRAFCGFTKISRRPLHGASSA